MKKLKLTNDGGKLRAKGFLQIFPANTGLEFLQGERLEVTVTKDDKTVRLLAEVLDGWKLPWAELKVSKWLLPLSTGLSLEKAVLQLELKLTNLQPGTEFLVIAFYRHHKL